MALRLIEMVVPEQDGAEVFDLLKDHNLLEHRQIRLGDEELLVVMTFLVQGIHPASWWEKDQAKKATHTALKLWVAMLVVLIILFMLFQKN